MGDGDGMSSRALVEKAAGGCRELFAALLEAYYARIYRLAWRFCGSQPLAEDIAQDVCVKLATAIRDYRGEAAFSTWVWRITYTTAIDRIRAAQHMLYVEPSAMAELAALPRMLALRRRRTMLRLLSYGLPCAACRRSSATRCSWFTART